LSLGPVGSHLPHLTLSSVTHRDICTINYTEVVNMIIYLGNFINMQFIYLLSILRVLRI